MIAIKTANTTHTETLALLSRITYAQSHGDFIGNEDHLFHYGNETFSIAKIQSELTDDTIIYNILYYDNFPIGYSKLILNATHESIKSQNVCRLERIYILNDFIHLKIGHHLLIHAFEKTRELAFDHLWLSVYIKNYRAIRFYEKNDFKNVGTLNFVVEGKGYENIVFSKNLLV